MADFAGFDDSHSWFSPESTNSCQHNAPRSDTSHAPVFASRRDATEMSGTGDIKSVTNPDTHMQPQQVMGHGSYVSPSAPGTRPVYQEVGFQFDAGTDNSMGMAQPGQALTGVPFEPVPFDLLGTRLQDDVPNDDLDYSALQSGRTLTDNDLSMGWLMEMPAQSHLTDLGAQFLVPPQPNISPNSVPTSVPSSSSRSTGAAQSGTPHVQSPKGRKHQWESVLKRIQHSTNVWPEYTQDSAFICNFDGSSISRSFGGLVALARKHKSKVGKWAKDCLSVSANVNRYATRTAKELHCGKAMLKWYEQTLERANEIDSASLAKAAKLTVSEFFVKRETVRLGRLFEWDSLERFLNDQGEANPEQVINGLTVTYTALPPRTGQEARSLSMQSYSAE